MGCSSSLINTPMKINHKLNDSREINKKRMKANNNINNNSRKISLKKCSHLLEIISDHESESYNNISKSCDEKEEFNSSSQYEESKTNSNNKNDKMKNILSTGQNTQNFLSVKTQDKNEEIKNETKEINEDNIEFTKTIEVNQNKQDQMKIQRKNKRQLCCRKNKKNLNINDENFNSINQSSQNSDKNAKNNYSPKILVLTNKNENFSPNIQSESKIAISNSKSIDESFNSVKNEIYSHIPGFTSVKKKL